MALGDRLGKFVKKPAAEAGKEAPPKGLDVKRVGALDATKKIAEGLRAENIRVAQQAEAERKERERLEAEMTSLRQQKSDIEIEIANIRKEAAGKYGPEAVEQVAQMTARITALEQELSRTQNELADMASQRDDLREGFQRFTQAIGNPSLPRDKVAGLGARFVSTFASSPTEPPAPTPVEEPRTVQAEAAHAARPIEPLDDRHEGVPEFKHFLKDMTVPREGATLPAQDMYEAYSAWCDKKGHDPVVAPKLSVFLQSAGYKKDRIGGRVRWIGIALKD